jgi:hypothetical protein
MGLATRSSTDAGVGVTPPRLAAQLKQIARQHLRGPLVRGPRPTRVHLQGRRAPVAVPKPAGGRPQVDTSGEQLGGVEVPQVLQRLADPQVSCQVTVGMREVVRVPRPIRRRRRREDERLVRQIQVRGRESSLPGGPQVRHDLHGRSIQREPAVLVRLSPALSRGLITAR